MMPQCLHKFDFTDHILSKHQKRCIKDKFKIAYLTELSAYECANLTATSISTV
jgi:hypothetical protein